MECPYCREGTIRASNTAGGRGLLAFCDNLNCFTWFNVPNAYKNADGIIEARDGIEVNPRVTQAQRARHPQSLTQFEAYAKSRKIVEEVG